MPKNRVALVTVLSLFSLIASAGPARAQEGGPRPPRTITIAPERVFIPTGFDHNDNAQIVVDGSLPDTCHKLASASAWTDHENRIVYVKVIARIYAGTMCAEMTVPYTQTVDLGLLEPGKYKVVAETEEKPSAMGVLPVAMAKSADPDDYLYAPVHDVRVNLRKDGVANLIVSGTFTNSCMRLADIRVAIIGDVIEVLPIMEIAGGKCMQIEREFSRSVELENVPAGRYLVHSRSLNGQSVNRVVDFWLN